MRIQIEPHVANVRGPALAPASSAFGALMDAAGPAADQAAGFDALGMFGRSQAAQAPVQGPEAARPDHPSRPSAAMAGLASAFNAGGAAATAGKGGPFDLRGGAAARSVGNGPSTPPGDIAQALGAQEFAAGGLIDDAPASPSSGPDAVDASGVRPDAPDGLERPGRTDHRARPDRPGWSARTPGLALLPDEAGMAVVVSGFQVPPDILAQFKTSARTILARHGLSLYKLVVNGAEQAAAPERKGIDPWR